MTRIAILGGRIIDPHHQIDRVTNLYIAEGRIVAINDALADFEPELTISAENLVVTPGLVDLHVNFMDVLSNTAAFRDRLLAATQVGVTNIGTYSFNEHHSFLPAEIQHLQEIAQTTSAANIYFISALMQPGGQRLNELALLKDAGCIGFSQGYNLIANMLVKRRCFEYASMLGLKLFIHPEEISLVESGFMHEGEVSLRHGIPGIPSVAETIGLAENLLLIESLGIHAHFCRLSARQSLELLSIAKQKKYPVTSDVAIHQLYLTEQDVALDNGLYHVRPPLRSLSDQQALRQAVKTGDIETITSDHVTLPHESKQVPFQQATPGIASWPLLLPLTLRLSEEENIPLSAALARITTAPAKILGIDAGHLTVGKPASITIFDPDAMWNLSDKDLTTFGANTPFVDCPLKGRVKYTIIDDTIVFKLHE